MTSIAIEEQFVKNFILKDKVKRICCELASNKKRDEAIQKIPCLLDSKYVVFSGKISNDKFIEIVKKYDCLQAKCNIISDDADDGGCLLLDEAINKLMIASGVFIAFTDKLAIIKDEYVSGAFSVCILSKKGV